MSRLVEFLSQALVYRRKTAGYILRTSIRSFTTANQLYCLLQRCNKRKDLEVLKIEHRTKLRISYASCKTNMEI